MNPVIDTNAYSDLMRGSTTIASLIAGADVVYLPVIVIGELKRGFYYGNRAKQNVAVLEDFISEARTRVLDITSETAEQYGRLAAYLKQQGTPIPINDVWIAAICVQYDLPLLTRDSDFERLPQVNLLTI
jgi:tRNA(fMet)-specific endonuclease VapC